MILLIMQYKEWEKAKAMGLGLSLFPKTLQPLFSVVDAFHNNSNETQQDLTVADLANLVFATVSKDHPYYQGVLEQLESLDVSDSSTRTLVKSLCENEKLKEISLAAYEVTEGRKTREEFNTLLSSFEDNTSVVEDEEDIFVSDNIEEVVNEAFSKPGLQWRLGAMNKMLGSLRKGDFGFVFARPETGKTTFLASEVSFMATQLTEASGPILWLINEEAGGKVLMRVYQSTFGITLAQLMSNLPHYKAKYQELTKGKIKFLDDSTATHQFIDKLCKKLSPSLVIIDQLSKVKGFAADRKDLELGKATTWARELAKRFCPVIATHQADGSGEGQKWLNMGHVADAKTAMQADADFILGVGKSNDPGYETLRYLALSKNKLSGDSGITDPNMRHGKIECIIEPHIGRYKDL